MPEPLGLVEATECLTTGFKYAISIDPNQTIEESVYSCSGTQPLRPDQVIQTLRGPDPVTQSLKVLTFTGQQMLQARLEMRPRAAVKNGLPSLQDAAVTVPWL